MVLRREGKALSYVLNPRPEIQSVLSIVLITSCQVFVRPLNPDSKPLPLLFRSRAREDDSAKASSLDCCVPERGSVHLAIHVIVGLLSLVRVGHIDADFEIGSLHLIGSLQRSASPRSTRSRRNWFSHAVSG